MALKENHLCHGNMAGVLQYQQQDKKLKQHGSPHFDILLRSYLYKAMSFEKQPYFKSRPINNNGLILDDILKQDIPCYFGPIKLMMNAFTENGSFHSKMCQQKTVLVSNIGFISNNTHHIF